MQHIYILKLDEGCYYVGKTSNVDARLDQHAKGTGSAWTQKHKVELLLDSFEEVHPIDELKTTLDLMAKHGIDKVRGDIYSQLVLSLDQHLSILRHLRSMANTCLACAFYTRLCGSPVLSLWPCRAHCQRVLCQKPCLWWKA